MREASVAAYIDKHEGDVDHISNRIAQTAFASTNVSCDPRLHLCVYVSSKREGRRREARFDIHPAGLYCCEACKWTPRTMCEGGDLCNRPIQILDTLFDEHSLPLYVPIHVVPYPFDKEGTHAHTTSSSESIWDDDVFVDEDAHANGMLIDATTARIYECDGNYRHRHALRRAYYETFFDYFQKKGMVMSVGARDTLQFRYHDLCRYAIPYMVLVPKKARRKHDFFKWVEDVAWRCFGIPKTTLLETERRHKKVSS